MDPQMPVALSKERKRTAGRTDREGTPLAIRFHGVEASAAFAERARRRISRKLGRFAFNITRITLRIEDDNGPKGGVDMTCRIKVVVPSAAAVIADGHGPDAYTAFDRALSSAERTLRRSLERRGFAAPAKPTSVRAKAQSEEEATSDVAASDGVTRHKRSLGRRAVSALERGKPKRPSRKSTRSSANRGKQDDKLRLRATLKTISPASKARRAHAKTRKKPGKAASR